LIARESEFVRRPAEAKRAGQFFAASSQKTAEPRVAFFGSFFGEAKKNSPLGESRCSRSSAKAQTVRGISPDQSCSARRSTEGLWRRGFTYPNGSKSLNAIVSKYLWRTFAHPTTS
jgi:hypothetical protein